MVSANSWKVALEGFAESIYSLPVIARGAESELRRGVFGGVEAIFKFRRRKEYMDAGLDLFLRRSRTLREAKILSIAFSNGVRVPRVLAVFPSLSLIVMEFIFGIKMKDAIENGLGDHCMLSYEAGQLVARLHDLGIVHGDPTTSNYIIGERDDEIYMIDFGLAEFTSDVEDFAVDLHLFRRAALSTHALVAEKMFSCFIRGYRTVRGDRAIAVIERAREIMLRGRYIEERRTVWRQ